MDLNSIAVFIYKINEFYLNFFCNLIFGKLFFKVNLLIFVNLENLILIYIFVK